MCIRDRSGKIPCRDQKARLDSSRSCTGEKRLRRIPDPFGWVCKISWKRGAVWSTALSHSGYFQVGRFKASLSAAWNWTADCRACCQRQQTSAYGWLYRISEALKSETQDAVVYLPGVLFLFDSYIISFFYLQFFFTNFRFLFLFRHTFNTFFSYNKSRIVD